MRRSALELCIWWVGTNLRQNTLPYKAFAAFFHVSVCLSAARESTVKDSDLEHFKQQASCLGFSGEPEFHYDTKKGASLKTSLMKPWTQDVWYETQLISFSVSFSLQASVKKARAWGWPATEVKLSSQANFPNVTANKETKWLKTNESSCFYSGFFDLTSSCNLLQRGAVKGQRWGGGTGACRT